MSNSTSKWFKYLTESQTMCEMCGSVHEGGCPTSSSRDIDYDDEGRMVKSQLYKIANYATELQEMIGDEDQLEGWVQSKIATVSSMIGSVKHYLEYEYKRGEHSIMEEDND